MILLAFLKEQKRSEKKMVAIVAMVIAYLVFCDLKVALYIGIGVILTRWLIESTTRNNMLSYLNIQKCSNQQNINNKK